MLLNSYDLTRGLSIGLGLLFGSVGPTLGILSYVFTAFALYTIARRRGIAHPWLAWIPVADAWLLGSLSDQYRYVARGQEKRKRIILLVLYIVMSSCGVAAVTFALVMMFGAPAYGATGLLGCILILLASAAAAAVLHFMALYDVYVSCDPENAVLFLVLSIFFGITAPLFLFLCRNKDGGMPPRREA